MLTHILHIKITDSAGLTVNDLYTFVDELRRLQVSPTITVVPAIENASGWLQALSVADTTLISGVTKKENPDETHAQDCTCNDCGANPSLHWMRGKSP